MFNKRNFEIDTAFKPIVRERQETAAGMIAYLSVVISALVLAQYTVVYMFDHVHDLHGEMKTALVPMIVIAILVTLFWSLRYVHWPVVLVLGVIYLVWLYLQITSKDTSSNSIRSLLDVLIRAYSDYYGFSWSGFEANKIVHYANHTTGNEYLFALLLIHLPFTVLLGYNMLRKFRLSSVALALLFPCFLIFMNGYTPDRHAFIRVLLLFAVLAVLGIQMKIEEKQQTVRPRNGSGSAGVFCIHPPKAVFPLFIMGLATVLAGMVFPMLAEEKMTDLVRPAQEFMYSGGPERLLKELRGRLFGTNSGGISGGDLASTGSIQPDKDHVLLKVWRSDGNNSRFTYLKCYVGEVYTGKRWADLPDIIRSQYRKSLTYSFNRREYRRLADVSVVLTTLTSGSNNLGDISIRNSLRIRLFSLDITNVDYQDGYYPLPYLTNHSDTFNAIQNPYLKEEFTIANYETASCNVPFLVRLYDAYMHEMGYMGSASDTPQNLANAFYDDLYYNSELGTYPQNNGRLIPALLFKYYGESSRTDEDEAYAQILKEYLNVPDSVKKLRTFMKDVKVDGVEDAIIYVREALDNLAEYSLTPGKISGNADFVDTFLFEKKAGYCMHFASAGTLMFRLLGFPARYVEGFYIGPSSTESQDLTEENAHAWTEIYLKNFGWVPIEVTPGFGSPDDWKKTERPQVRPTVAETTSADPLTSTSAPKETTSAVDKTKESSSVWPTGGHNPYDASMIHQSSSSTEENDTPGTPIFPIVFMILKVIVILIGVILLLYLLIMFRRGFLLSRRNHGFTQHDLKKSVAAMYADMKKLASIEGHSFTYETDAHEVVSWFDELEAEEQLVAEAIELINRNFFGNRPIEPEDRKTIAKARNKLAAAVAKRQTGRKKLRYHLWYGY